MDSGWIKIHRKFRQHPFYKNIKYKAVWLEMVLRATHKPMKAYLGGKTITIKPGQFISTAKEIANSCGVKIGNIHRIKTELKSEGQISEQVTGRKTLFTVNNWNQYQQNKSTVEKQMSSKRKTDELRIVIQEDKEDKNKRNNKRKVYATIFEFWNSLKIIFHKKLTKKIETKINFALKEYSEKDIKKAIKKYSTVLGGNKYFWTHKWTLEEFLARGLTKFVDKTLEDFEKSFNPPPPTPPPGMMYEGIIAYDPNHKKND